ncbi:unnamed protein product [Laminaria digitata]
MCFPVVFPLGVGDPFNDLRRRRVKFSEAIMHLMKFVDRPPPIDGVPQVPHYRFASHRTFRYWCLDTKMRRTAKEQLPVLLSPESRASPGSRRRDNGGRIEADSGQSCAVCVERLRYGRVLAHPTGGI